MAQDLSDYRDYCWKYFALHADQRLKVFQFYITIYVALTAGLLAFAREPDRFANGWPLGLLMTFFSFVFWQLDKRTKEMIKHVEAALMQIEDEDDLGDEENGRPHAYKVFCREKYETDLRSRLTSRRFLKTPWSYSQAIHGVYLILGLGGAFLAVYLVRAWLRG